MEVLKKIVNIVIDIGIILVVIASAAVATLSLTTDIKGVSNIMGYTPLAVQSDSMSPTFEVGDMIIGYQEDMDYVYKAGDVITFKMYERDDKGEIVKNPDGTDKIVYNTHRIVEAYPKGMDDGIPEPTYITKGDNEYANPDPDPVLASNIICHWSNGLDENGKDKTVVCGPIKGIGSIMDFLRDSTGFALVVVLPMAGFFIYELFRFISNLIEYRRENAREAALEAARAVMAESGGSSSSDDSGLSEEEKARVIQEYLAKQAAEKKKKPDKTDNSGDNPTEESDTAETD